jgi:hypothetical protein
MTSSLRENIMKPTQFDAPLLMEGFPMIPRAQQEILWFQRRFGRSQHDKQNKQTTFPFRYIIYIPVSKPSNQTGFKQKALHMVWVSLLDI